MCVKPPPTEPDFTAKHWPCLSVCLHCSSDYFQLAETSFCHLNCDNTRNFAHSLILRTQIFLFSWQNKLLVRPNRPEFPSPLPRIQTLMQMPSRDALDGNIWILLRSSDAKEILWGFFFVLVLLFIRLFQVVDWGWHRRTHEEVATKFYCNVECEPSAPL